MSRPWPTHVHFRAHAPLVCGLSRKKWTGRKLDRGQLWQPKVDRPRAKAKCRVKARARVRTRARARAQIMPIRPPLQAFVRADHFLQAKIGPGSTFYPGVTGDMASQGIWHPRVKFPRDFGIPTGNLAPPRF